MIITNFNQHCDYLGKICKEHNIDYKRYDLGFVVYPDGYTDNIIDKQYFLELITINDFTDKNGDVHYKHCSKDELINYLIDFKNGIINQEFCLDNVTKIKQDIKELKFSTYDDEEDELENKENTIFSKYDYLER